MLPPHAATPRPSGGARDNARMPDIRPPAIALYGPTASGKTALAVRWAQAHGGEIVSVDSALVYRGLDIGAAKPTAAERGGIVHHLIDIRDPWQAYSAAEFAHDARIAIDAVLARGRMPILVGGTGLYMRALLDGLSDMPPADASVREALAARAREVGWAAMHRDLAAADPVAAARIHATDAQRIQRALEVLELTGRPLSHWQQAGPPRPRLPVRVLRIAIAPPRAELHARIALRFDAMLDAGLLDEVRALRALPALRAHAAPLELPALRAVGYRQAWEYLDGAVDAGAFRARAIAATRQLAKRQTTWLRGLLDTRVFDPGTQAQALDDALALFLDRRA